jgi:hypothetical protein
VTIETATNETFQAQLEVDAGGALWLRDDIGGRYQLAVALQGGWRVVDSTPAEREVLEAHGFASGRMQWPT